MALDEKNKRLLVGARTPAKLLVLDTASLEWITEVVLPDATGDVFYDQASRQVVVLCGSAKVPGFAGVVISMAQYDPDHYKITKQTITAADARAGAWWRAGKLLAVGAPANKDQAARVIALVP
jgi:hypothetical protein